MNIKIKTTTTIIFLLANLSLYANRAQVWTQEDVSSRVEDTPFILQVSQENRIGVNSAENHKHIDEIHAAPTLWYNAASWLDVGVNDRLVLLRDGSDARYKTDHRPGVDVKLKTGLYGWDLSNRSRFIYRQVEHEHGYFRYRNLSRVDAPWKFTSSEIRPYMSYEWYFDEGCKERRYRTCDKFSTQWITGGVTFKLYKNLRGDLHYMLTETRDRATGKWCPGHVVGVGVSMAF